MNHDLPSIMKSIERIDPEQYASTRNFTDGAVTNLSPYISRGVISAKTVFDRLLQRHGYPKCRKLVQELLWREYFQRLLQHGWNLHDEAVKGNPAGRHGIPLAVLHAKTGIAAVDQSIVDLYTTGRMHNHLRMYVAAICCNVAKCDFKFPAKWLYYHLLDADVASNSGSWQWVGGTLTGIPYYANQENINRYCGTGQQGTFLDLSYEELPNRPIPEILEEIALPELESLLPETPLPNLSLDTVLLYTHYNLDPEWRKDTRADRVLLLEPSHFKKFPLGEVALRFIFSLMSNIPGLQLYCGELADLGRAYPQVRFIAKEHPLFAHWDVQFDQRDWMVPDVVQAYPSFSKYYKECEKKLQEHE